MKNEPKKNKKTSLSLASSKLLLTFALPIARKGIEEKKNRLSISRTATPTGYSIRSLNVWKRQIVRAFSSDIGSKNYKRNTNT